MFLLLYMSNAFMPLYLDTVGAGLRHPESPSYLKQELTKTNVCTHMHICTAKGQPWMPFSRYYYFVNEMWSITSMEVAKQTGLARQYILGPSYLHFPRARIINVYHHA